MPGTRVGAQLPARKAAQVFDLRQRDRILDARGRAVGGHAAWELVAVSNQVVPLIAAARPNLEPLIDPFHMLGHVRHVSRMPVPLRSQARALGRQQRVEPWRLPLVLGTLGSTSAALIHA